MGDGNDNNHESRRKTLTVIGIVLLIVGSGLLIVGVLNFSTPFRMSNEEFFAKPREMMDRSSRASFRALALLMMGGISTTIGLSLLRFAQQGRIARYKASEIAPVVNDTLSYLAGEPENGLTKAGAALSGKSNEVVKIRCRACGHLEREDVKFCSECAQPL